VENNSSQDLNNDNNEQPTVSDRNWLTKNFLVLLILLVVVFVVSISGYFLLRKTSELPVVEVVEPSTIELEDSSITTNTETDEVESGNYMRHYWVKDSVVYNRSSILDADVSTFQELRDGWAKDKDFVYRDGQKQAYVDIDPKTLRVISPYVLDKDNVWTSNLRTIDKITNADVKSFTVLKGINYPYLEGPYAKDKNTAYYYSNVIQNADVNSLVFLGGEYAKDKNRVYKRGEVLPDVDTDSFVFVGNYYTKDKNQVFYEDEKLDIEIDPASFEFIYYSIIKDDKRVYFFNYDENKYYLVDGVDASTFQYVGICSSVKKSTWNYFKDKNHVFTMNLLGGDIVKSSSQIDISTFKYFGNYVVADGIPYSFSYAKDKDNVYYSCGAVLADADVTTFVDLGDGYAKDKNNIWYFDKVISGADVDTFQVLGGGYAKDKDNAYFIGRSVKNADAETFIFVKNNIVGFGSYAMDKDHIYHYGDVVSGGLHPVGRSQFIDEDYREN